MQRSNAILGCARGIGYDSVTRKGNEEETEDARVRACVCFAVPAPDVGAAACHCARLPGEARYAAGGPADALGRSRTKVGGSPSSSRTAVAREATSGPPRSRALHPTATRCCLTHRATSSMRASAKICPTIPSRTSRRFRRLAREGCDVALAARIANRLRQTASAIDATNSRRIVAVPCSLMC